MEIKRFLHAIALVYWWTAIARAEYGECNMDIFLCPLSKGTPPKKVGSRGGYFNYDIGLLVQDKWYDCIHL